MAHIFYGNRTRFYENADVAQAAATLGDEYWFLFEFDVPGGNVDCLIIKPAQPDSAEASPSTVILTEIKHVTGQLSGFENGTWAIRRNGTESDYLPSNAADINPWQQTIRVLNAFRAWMTNNQRAFLDPGVTHEYNDLKVWPTLLIVRTDADEPHALPYGPSNRFGNFCFSLEDWLRNISTWSPRLGVTLTVDTVQRLVRGLQLTEWTQDRASTEQPTNAAGAVPATAVDAAPPPEPVVDEPAEIHQPLLEGLEWIDGLLSWASDVERRLAALEASARTPRPRAPQPTGVTRDLTVEERDAMLAVTREIAESEQSRAFPNVARLMSERLGYNLKEQRYNGFGTASAFFNQAVKEGVIRYGPLSGPSPTIYLADETVPSAPEPNGS